MNRHYIPLCVFISACTTQYSLYIKPNDPWEPADENITPTDNITSDTPEDIVSDSDEPAVEETPVGDTDLVPSDTPIDTDIQHPTMDTYGNPLYPTVPEDFTDTGVVPLGVPGTIEDCNIPDDFMLVTYVDLDQDGFGSDPYSTWWDTYDCDENFYIFSTYGTENVNPLDPNSNSYDHFTTMRGDISNWRAQSMAHPDGSDFGHLFAPYSVSNLSITLFYDIYDKASGVERFYSALNIINTEGFLTYELTAQMALTNERKTFRDQLVAIAETRCLQDNFCNNSIFSVRPAFTSDIYLTYEAHGNTYKHGSAYGASFWKGDSEVEYNSVTFCNNHYSSFNRRFDVDPNLNEGFFTCSWFGDDVDGDGFTLEEGDCHDGAAWINPAASEIPSNGADNNCDGYEDCFADNDGDGRAGLTNIITISGTDCSQYGRPTDCNDNNPLSYPGAPENSCDGIDQDCDGTDM